ncbi:MAG TPA: cytochrome c-type biogenesis protein CcmH [Patescibacteria group bacterium]|nr:cytochrome c-type biogenesis protein CcmH [Patescibacteria group bacterium]
MSRWLPVVALGLAIAVAGIVVALLTAPAAMTDAERTAALAAELRCPDCQGLSVADSPTSSAREIRRQIDELVAGGATDDEVRAHFVARYGEWIRLAPSSTALWLIPFGVVLAGLVLLGAWLIRRPRAAIASDVTVTDAQRRAVHEEAEALDA